MSPSERACSRRRSGLPPQMLARASRAVSGSSELSQAGVLLEVCVGWGWGGGIGDGAGVIPGTWPEATLASALLSVQTFPPSGLWAPNAASLRGIGQGK